MRSWGLAAAVSALLLAASASAVSGKGRTTVQLASAPPAGLVTGRPWTAVLVVKGGRPARVALTATSGGRRVAATARRRRGNRYRARLVFRSAGRWALTARVGRVRFRLGAVRVRMQTPPPILFFYPTELGFDRSGALLVVENGRSRVLRIDSRSARVSTFVEAARPFGIAVAPSGDVYLSDSNTVLRIDAARRTTTVARADSDVGPLAVDSAGNVYFTTATRIFRIEGGTGPVTHYAGTGVEGGGGDGGPALQAEFRAPHGLAVGADGALYVSDTGNDRVRRIDPVSRVITTFAPARIPDGLGVGPDGALYIAAFGAHRVLRVDRSGNVTVAAGNGARGSTGDGGPATAARLDGPFDIAVAADGTLFIVQAGPAGRIRRVDPSGTVSTLRRRT